MPGVPLVRRDAQPGRALLVVFSGEKYVNPRYAGQELGDATSADDGARIGDGPFYSGSNFRNARRTFSQPIARFPDQYGAWPADPAAIAVTRFGSNHPGVCQFAFGDGAARAPPVTLDLTTLQNMGNIADGNVITLDSQPRGADRWRASHGPGRRGSPPSGRPGVRKARSRTRWPGRSFMLGENPAWDTLPADRQADLARRMAVYAAMVECMDRNVGRVLDDLKANGELDNTLVLFLSDNGACAEWDPFGFDVSSGPKNVLHTGDKLAEMGTPATYHSYGSGWANAGCTPFRMYKHDCHEGGIRTPLVAHWPAGFAARGEFRDQVGHLVDVMATCVDVCGATYPARNGEAAITPMEGRSLRPAFAGKPLDREYLAWEHQGNRAVRVGNRKLVAKADAAWELYDIGADPAELTDLAAKHPDKVKELAAKWDAWAKRCDVLPYPVPKKK